MSALSTDTRCAEEVKEDVKEEPPKGALAALLRGEKPEVQASKAEAPKAGGRSLSWVC